MATAISPRPYFATSLVSPPTSTASSSKFLHPHSKPMPRPKLRRSRSPSPASSICSRATSVDDLEEISRISYIRPMYDSSNSIDGKLSDLSLSPNEGPPFPFPSPRANGSHADKPVTKEGEVVASSIKRFAEEEDEDILRETDNRFVLFPIRYRSVSQL